MSTLKSVNGANGDNGHVKTKEEHEMEMETEADRGNQKRRYVEHAQNWWHAMLVSYAFTHPHVRSRLEKLMGANLARLSDKDYMQELEERIYAVNEEYLSKRISGRELGEMERLKRLILCSKTPLNECPPELYNHSVFVFWRQVNREVARASKKRADAYYRKLGTSRRVEVAPEEEVAKEEEEGPQLTPNELLQRCREELAAQQLADIEAGVRLKDEEFGKLKYETEDLKKLKVLTTVEELYKLADQIVGIPRSL